MIAQVQRLKDDTKDKIEAILQREKEKTGYDISVPQVLQTAINKYYDELFKKDF